MSFSIITGAPGAGKSLMTVWEIARHVPGSMVKATDTVESHGTTYRAGELVPRHLFCNIPNLVVDHQLINAENLRTWHEWAQPGDVIIYDEAQEVFRTRALGVAVPPAIAAMETHRHRGVDIVLITQHPNLLDANLRRLVNQHLHVRRMASFLAMVYEWDHCSDPGRVRTAFGSRTFWYPRKAFALYKSASLHTKARARLPGVVFVGLAVLVGLAVGGPMVYSRLAGRFEVQAASAAAPGAPGVRGASAGGASVSPAGGVAALPVAPASAAAAGASSPVVPASSGGIGGGGGRAVVVSGCGVVRGECRCFGTQGEAVDAVPGTCEALTAGGPVLDLDQMAGGGGGGGVVSDGASDSDVLAFMARRRGQP